MYQTEKIAGQWKTSKRNRWKTTVRIAMETLVATTFMTPLAVLAFTGAASFLIQEIAKTSHGGTIGATEIEDLAQRLL